MIVSTQHPDPVGGALACRFANQVDLIDMINMINVIANAANNRIH